MGGISKNEQNTKLREEKTMKNKTEVIVSEHVTYGHLQYCRLQIMQYCNGRQSETKREAREASANPSPFYTDSLITLSILLLTSFLFPHPLPCINLTSIRQNS